MAVLSMSMKSKLVEVPQESFGHMSTGAWMTLLILFPLARNFLLVDTITRMNFKLIRLDFGRFQYFI